MKSKERISKYQKQVNPLENIPENREEMLVYYLKKVEDRVADQLDAETLKISEKKVPFVEPPKDENKQLTLRLREIQESKERVQARLKEVSEQQRHIKSQQRYHIGRKDPKERSISPFNAKTKSELSQTDLTLLRKLKKEQRQFQKSLEHKTLEYEQRLKDMKKEEEELKERHRKQETEARKKEVALKMEVLQKKREEKAKQFQEERLKMVQLKAKKKLFEQLQEKQKELEREQFQAKVAAMEERFKQREIDLQDLKEHQQRYRERKAQLQAERQRKKEEQDEMARESRLYVDKSKFYTLIVHEGKKRKDQQLKKMKEKLELVEAARGYAENIKREHAPRVKTKSSEGQKEKQKKEGLTFQETKDVGNSYFQFMKKIPKKHKKNESVVSTASRKHNETPKPLRTLSTKYKDYLSQQRKIRHPQDEKMSVTRISRIRDRGMMKEVDQACKLVGGKDKRQGLERLQYIASKLENHRGEQDHNMLDKISAKLKILQVLTNR